MVKAIRDSLVMVLMVSMACMLILLVQFLLKIQVVDERTQKIEEETRNIVEIIEKWEVDTNN
jgi:hypothetical protein